MNATKPTVRTNDVAAMRALQQGADYVIAPLLGQPHLWSVRKEGQREPYVVNMRTRRCTCPHDTQKLAGTNSRCKHTAMVSLKLEIAGRMVPDAPATPTEAELDAAAAARRAKFFAPD